MTTKEIIKKTINFFGLDIKRYVKRPKPLDFIKHFEIQTILDIGANTGQFAKEARLVTKDAQIYSFEPLPQCYADVNKLFDGDNKFKSFNFALGDLEEEKTIHQNEYTPSSSILDLGNVHKQKFPYATKTFDLKIKIKKLDEIYKTLRIEPNLLVKIDVQGYEDKVINGGMETLSSAKAILIENSFIELYSGQPTFDKIYRKLNELGFQYSGSIQQKIDRKTSLVISQDSLFVKI